ncbi:SDR family NAD(P)-dependent oxidoreductase [Insolitispirillum peregrinum]|uniref:Short-chain dehydrogenase n=1 Tax=Insolitispirillum peregrinum TaxID=80876 RepID=A0A1N7IHX4_9PROT|nr:SDR family NAD(P)-dependent oxidoreductase [Insolitispirillum peregrinum]SIS36687.1 Short-chain dehydrogenase [Insolitispirillum peregrinum]
MSSRIAWVTGAGKGIGAAVAVALAREGWTVAVSARTADDLERLARQVGDVPGGIHPVPLDVTDEDAVARAVAVIEQTLGPIELAILNAGTHCPMDVDDFSCATLRRLWEVNVMGTSHCLAAVMPRLTARRRGRIMMVASVAGYIGLPTAAAYGPGKAALINLAESLHPGLKERGVTLQLVNPGFVKTPLTDKNDFPMPFLISADTAAARIIAATRSHSFEVTFPRRFTWMLKVIRCLPYGLSLPLIKAITRG